LTTLILVTRFRNIIKICQLIKIRISSSHLHTLRMCIFIRQAEIKQSKTAEMYPA